MANSLLYGFMQLKDLAATRAIEVDRDLLISSIEMTVEEHNREVNRILNLFSEETDIPQLQFNGSAITRNQPLDENGRPRPIKPVAPYTVGFPIWTSGNAWGANRITNAKLTVQKLNDIIGQILYGDFAWLRDQLLGTLFDNVGYSVTDPIVGNVAVKGLANSDTVTYGDQHERRGLAGDRYALPRASQRADDGHTTPSRRSTLSWSSTRRTATDVVAFINSAESAAVQGITGFVGINDPNIRPANTSAVLIGTLDAAVPARATLLGRLNNVWVYQWNAIPATYIVAMSIGGTPPLKRRVDPEPELQGFKAIERIDTFPFFQDNWQRRMGFGGWNRVGAVVMRTGNGSYAVPTNYTVPMS
jgi:hypothetical protein